MLSKIRKTVVHNPDYPGPALAEDEVVVLEDVIPLVAGFGGARLGTLRLTSQRLIWYETVSPWPLKRITGEIHLADATSVDRTGLVDGLIFGGRRLRLRFRSGEVRRVDWNHSL
jgi:hypothetical protein